MARFLRGGGAGATTSMRIKREIPSKRTHNCTHPLSLSLAGDEPAVRAGTALPGVHGAQHGQARALRRHSSEGGLNNNISTLDFFTSTKTL